MVEEALKQLVEAFGPGPGSIIVLLILGLVAFWKYHEKTMRSVSKAKTEVQEKRLLDRDEVVRALTTNNIVMEKVAASTEQNNRALEAQTRTIMELGRALESVRRELERVYDRVAARP